MEKYRTWSDCGGDVESRFTKDELLTTVTIYWVTQSIGSSTKLYYETHRKPWNLKQGERIEVPCGIASFPGENTVPIREWAERSYNVQHWTDMASGGHFAALEEPVQTGGRYPQLLPPITIIRSSILNPDSLKNDQHNIRLEGLNDPSRPLA
ncbi:MAG: hypothetical protein CM1200mP22_15440 [Dehalococcoidia bacterium]|nr:MAG: hypothetical protein CM1200mP22_15440 [Dehalococcoidia bacterium]